MVCVAGAKGLESVRVSRDVALKPSSKSIKSLVENTFDSFALELTMTSGVEANSRA